MGHLPHKPVVKSLIFLVTTLAIVGTSTAADTPPVIWHPPSTFTAALNSHGLGLPRLKGAVHEIIYAPLPSNATTTGTYESTLHGLYNHSALSYRSGDTFILAWCNHAIDEGGPGQRTLARTGTLSENGAEIIWLPGVIELAPTPVLVKRRTPSRTIPDPLAEHRFAGTSTGFIDSQFRVTTSMSLAYGWTNNFAYSTSAGSNVSVPAANFSLTRTGNFTYDLVFKPAPTYYQLWQLNANGTLSPSTSLYASTNSTATLTVTPGTTLNLAPPRAPYDTSPLLSTANATLRDTLTKKFPIIGGTKGWTSGKSVAADGKNGLAHMTQFQRPDGLWTIIRDNLESPGHYYAATAAADSTYDPAVETNLYGYVMPASGSLPDSRNWILGNSENRYEFFLTLSTDGINFDRTWRILTINKTVTGGFGKADTGGPQYPNVITTDDSIFIFYSIAKEQIGLTRIPFAAFDTQPTTLLSETFPQNTRTQQNPPSSLAWFSSSTTPTTLTPSNGTHSDESGTTAALPLHLGATRPLLASRYSLVATSTAAPLPPPTLSITPTATEFQHAAAQLPATKLAIGDVLTLTADITFPSISTTAQFRAALLDSAQLPNNQLSADGSSTAANNSTSTGYAAQLTTISTKLSLLSRNTTAAPLINTTDAYTSLSTNNTTNLQPNQPYRLEVELTRANSTHTRLFAQLSSPTLPYPLETEATITGTSTIDTLAFASNISSKISSITLSHLPLAPRPQLASSLPPATIAIGNSTILSVSAANGTFTYQWLLNNSPIPGATTNTLNATTNGTFTCQITNSHDASIGTSTRLALINAPDDILTYALTDNFTLTETNILNTGGSTDHLPSTTTSNNTLSLTFTPLRETLTYTIEHSTDLHSWLPIHSTTGTSTSPQITIPSPSPTTDLPQQFLRLKITPTQQ